MFKIEKDTYTASTDYVVFGSHRISANLLRSVLFLWLFFGIAFFTYTIGKNDTYQNMATTAYICGDGVLTNKETGARVSCAPLINKNDQIEWNCTNYTEGIATAKTYLIR